MKILDELIKRNAGRQEPILVNGYRSLFFSDISEAIASQENAAKDVRAGEVVAIIGDFDGPTISAMLHLLDQNVIVMPLTDGTHADHEYFFEAGYADWVMKGGVFTTRPRSSSTRSPLLDELQRLQRPGIIFFSSGTTGRPKAILHDFYKFIAKYHVPRPPLRALIFLLFDHAGGINTLLHILFNGGVAVVPSDRTPTSVGNDLQKHAIELLPATPTFLLMMMLEGIFETMNFPALRTITYGTERMDQSTLDRLCSRLPLVDFRQTYGLSELGVFQVKSKSRDSLWMRIGGQGVETRVEDNVLYIRSENAMVGYLNSASPFVDGWYETGDIVETEGDFIQVIGRAKEILNIGGLKILPTEIERVALLHPDVLRAKASGVNNPISGQYIEIICQPRPSATLNKQALATHFKMHLQKQLCPHRIIIGEVAISHRFKQK